MPDFKGFLGSFLKGNHSQEGRSCPVIAVTAEKGGVGKTTTAVNLSANLSLFYQKKVLVVDMDPQGHVSEALKGLNIGHPAVPLSEVLIENRPDISPCIVACSIKDLYIAPSDRALRQTETALSARIGKEFKLAKALSTVSVGYDIIVIDSPPNLGNLTVNAMVAASHVIIPVDMSPLAMQALENISQTLEILYDSIGRAPELLGILMTRYDKRRHKVNREILNTLQDHFESAVFNTVIPENTAVTKSQMQGVPLVHYDSRSSASMAYMELTKEVLSRLEDSSI